MKRGQVARRGRKRRIVGEIVSELPRRSARGNPPLLILELLECGHKMQRRFWRPPTKRFSRCTQCKTLKAIGYERKARKEARRLFGAYARASAA